MQGTTGFGRAAIKVTLLDATLGFSSCLQHQRWKRPREKRRAFA